MRNIIKNSLTTTSVFRALDILKSLGDGAQRLTDISNRVNLNKTTTYRLLKTLEASGFVVQDPVTQRYYLGHIIACLASSPTISHQMLIVYAFDEMRYLQDLSGETVGLQIKVGAQRMVLEELSSNHNVRSTLGKGFVSPLHRGAGGKILLSQLTDSERQIILNATKLVSMTTNKIIDKEALVNEVNKIKKKGYAITFSEVVEGNAAIAVPIKNYVCPAGLLICGPENRFRKNIMNFRKELKESAARISRKFVEG